MKISTILDSIDLGSMALPEFQRGYVWNRDQVRGLMRSLYRKHPVGSLLVWVTNPDEAKTRGDGPLAPGAINLLLDGQHGPPAVTPPAVRLVDVEVIDECLGARAAPHHREPDHAEGCAGRFVQNGEEVLVL